MLIEKGLILQSVIYKVEVFYRDYVVTRCYKCYRIGYTARVCKRQEYYGYYIALGHRDNACALQKNKGQAKCVNYGGPHLVQVSRCKVREDASIKVKQAFLSRPRIYSASYPQSLRESLREVNRGEWQVTIIRKKRSSTNSALLVSLATKRGRPRGLDLAGANQRGEIAEYLNIPPST